MATTEPGNAHRGRDVIWRLLDGVGLEHCRLASNETGPVLTGTVVTVNAGEPCSLTYALQCDRHWHARELLLEVVRGSESEPFSLHLIGDGDGEWVRRRQEGERIAFEPLPEFTGCIDLDLGFTPATNTLPIRRLQLAVFAKTRVTALWVEFPSFALKPLPQQYHRLAKERYRYDSYLHGFTALLEVDDLGLVTKYQDLWERVASSDAPATVSG